MNFNEQTIENFIHDLQSDLPSPGGGAVAGLVSALSGGLNSMVYSLTVSKKTFKELDEETRRKIESFQEKSNAFTVRSLELMEEDRTNFLELMKSYKLPKESEEEKKQRNLAIKTNTIKSMEAPLALVRECFDFFENLNVMLEYGNKMLLTDLQMSAILLHSAIESSVVNVKINLNSLKNEDFYENINEEIHLIISKSQKEKERICTSIENTLYK